MSIIDEDLQESPGQGQPLFSAILTPHRSLSQQGFLILMSLFAVLSLVIGVVFFIYGAWPVLGFLGLEFAFIYFAFRMNYRAGRLYETVEVYKDVLVVERVLPSGKVRQWTFNPYWVRVISEQYSDSSVSLYLYSHELKLEIGKFLLDYEKIDFAMALKDILVDYRGGVRI